MAVQSIHLLGAFEVVRDGKPLTAGDWRNQQTRTLLKLLLARRGHVVPADQLQELLWPEADPESARRNLYVRISQLRRALDPDAPDAYVLTVEGGYTFDRDADCRIDVVEFEERAREGRCCQEEGNLDAAIAAYEAAHSLYRGDFLEEDLYEDWAFAERERLRERFLALLIELAECHARQGHYRHAITRCREVLAADPCRESVYVRLMLYHYYAGERDLALRVYERCRQVLRDELGVEPLPQTTALYEKVLRRQVAPIDGAMHYPEPADAGRLFEAPYSLGQTPFVGRQQEYAWLIGRLRRAAGDNGAAVAIAGEAGLGKTRLAEQALGYLQERGFRVLASRCYEIEANVPYHPLVEALQPLTTGDVSLAPEWIAELARLFPHLRRSGEQPPAETQQHRLFEAVARLLAATATTQPTVVFVDDVQWADAASLSLLGYLTRQTRDIAWLLTYRPEETPPGHPLRILLDGLRRDGHLAELELTPLSPDAVATLLTQMSGTAIAAGLGARLAQESGGNLFYLVNILQNLFEEGVLTIAADGTWMLSHDLVGGPSDLMLPATLRQALERRLNQLERGDRRVLEAAAVLGHEFDFDLLRHTVKLDEEMLLDALDRLVEGRLLEEREASGTLEYDFSHDQLRQVTYLCTGASRRQRLHRLAGESLERLYVGRPALAGELAHHFEQAGEWGLALPHLCQAGRSAAALFAYDEALDFWSRAFSAFARLPEAEAPSCRKIVGDALVARAELFHLQGRIAERQADLQRLRQLAEESADVELLDHALIRQAHYLNLDGDYVQALERAQAAAARCRQRGDTDGEAQALAEWGFAHYFLGEYSAALQPLQAALQLAPSDPAVQGEVLSVLSYACYLVADYPRSLDYRQQALVIRSVAGQQARVAEDLTDMGILHTRLNQLTEAEHYLLEALKLARKIGSQPAESYALNNLGSLHYLRGNYLEALQCYTDSLVLQRATGSRRGEASALANSGAALLALGDYTMAETFLRQSLVIQEEIGYKSGLSEGLACLSLVLANLGRPEEALAVATRSLAVARDIGDRYDQVMALNALARLRLALNEPAVALALAGEAVALAQESNLMPGYIFGLALLGLAHLALGDAQTAGEYSTQAVALLRKQGRMECPEEEVYFAHYRVLAALGQFQEADLALRQARAEVMSKAGKLEGEHRRRFLEDVTINRQIMAADPLASPAGSRLGATAASAPAHPCTHQ